MFRSDRLVPVFHLPQEAHAHFRVVKFVTLQLSSMCYSQLRKRLVTHHLLALPDQSVSRRGAVARGGETAEAVKYQS